MGVNMHKMSRDHKVSNLNRIEHNIVPPEKLPFLRGMRTEFSSLAEMITVRAKEIPNRAHVFYYDQVISYSQTNERANHVANYLRSHGVKKGDIISLLVLNSPDIYYIIFGIMKLGAIAGSINFLFQGPEIAYLLDDCRPKFIFVGSEFMATFAKAYEMANHKPKVVEVNTGFDHAINIKQEQFACILDQYPEDEVLADQKPKDPCMLLYSSGTTGRPKGILLSNAGHFCSARGLASIGLVEGEDVILMNLPMFHVNPISTLTTLMTYCGQTICIRKTFSPSDFWPTVLNYEVTMAMAVPAMWMYVYNNTDVDNIDRSKLRLKKAICGGAPLPVDIIKAIKDKFNLDIIDGYGLTEATGNSVLNPVLGKKKPGSIGLAVPGQEIEIMDDENRRLVPGEVGEICIRSDTVMLGYLNNPEATKHAIRDGWLHTGDMAYMDEDGFIFIVDRKKDMINRGGENIYPREIEIALESNPKIREVAVIGVPDKALGERVKAYIVLKEPNSITEEEVKNYLQGKIAKFKIPEVVEFVTDFPRNPTGKILKKELRK